MILYSPVHSPVWIKHLRSSPFKHAFFLIGCPLPSESGWGLLWVRSIHCCREIFLLLVLSARAFRAVWSLGTNWDPSFAVTRNLHFKKKLLLQLKHLRTYGDQPPRYLSSWGDLSWPQLGLKFLWSKSQITASSRSGVWKYFQNLWNKEWNNWFQPQWGLWDMALLFSS